MLRIRGTKPRQENAVGEKGGKKAKVSRKGNMNVKYRKSVSCEYFFVVRRSVCCVLVT